MNIKEQRQFVESLHKRARSLQESAALAAVLETLSKAEAVEDDGDPYQHACEIMEQEQKKRAARGVEIGTEGSLCDGLSWLYVRLQHLEEAQTTRKPEWLWHYGTPSKRDVYRVKCDGPNPNAGYRYWDGIKWHAWSSTPGGARGLYKAGTRSGAYRRPIMYATKAK